MYVLFCKKFRNTFNIQIEIKCVIIKINLKSFSSSPLRRHNLKELSKHFIERSLHLLLPILVSPSTIEFIYKADPLSGKGKDELSVLLGRNLMVNIHVV